jgi:hypothetical protein
LQHLLLPFGKQAELFRARATPDAERTQERGGRICLTCGPEPIEDCKRRSCLGDGYIGLGGGEAPAELEPGACLLKREPRGLERRQRRALHDVVDVSDGSHAAGRVDRQGRVVVLLDTYERLLALDEWLRTWLLPRLPATAVTVIAGRTPPGPGWRADPAWRELARIVALRNLRPDEAREYLRVCGVDDVLYDLVIDITHGHPLGLSLLADVISRGGEIAPTDPLTPDLVGTLLRQFIDVVPSGAHRRVLEVCALARVTTEALLRDTLDVADAHQLFAWLRGLSFVESGPDGVFPHDLARDALDADLRWRDPDGYKRLFRAVRAHVHRRLGTVHGREQQRAVFDEKFLFRHQPAIRAGLDWDSWGQYYPERLRAADAPTVLDVVQRWQGPESAAIAERWLRQQPEGCFVVRRRDDVVRGFVAIVDLTRASAQDIAADPGARAAWQHVQRQAPPRPGETVSQLRFQIDRELDQRPSPTFNSASILSFQHTVSTPNLSWYLVTLSEPERWQDYFTVIDLPRVAGADFVVGGRRYGLFAHNFRAVPVEAWLDLTTERALAADSGTRRTAGAATDAGAVPAGV